MIHFYDYSKRFPHAKSDLVRYIREQSCSGEFILKSAVGNLEEALCRVSGARHAVCVSSATAAMTLALKAYGIGSGDEVITPALSYVSTASVILQTGATPVFVDVTPDSFTLDPVKVAEAVTERTKAVIPAHLFSGLADIAGIRQVLADGIRIIEDSATAFGASKDGVAAGRHGDVGVYSFFPAKPLGGIGDGGVMLTDDDQLASTVRMLRNHGQDGKTRFLHHSLGFNSRMDDINARWIMDQLDQNDDQLARRRAIARRYDRAFECLVGPVRRQERNTAEFVPHAYALRVTERDALVEHMRAHGVETRIHFPVPLPMQPAFAAFGGDCGRFPVSAALARELISIPLHSGMTDGEVETVIDTVVTFWN